MDNIDKQYKYEQKKINHVFHYTSVFQRLQGIILEGFFPSYCKEKVGDSNYMTPMVSFCNIPIAEVDKYMRYGKNGIGMSLNWAVRNGLTPVTYIHENSPYHNIISTLNWVNHNLRVYDETSILENKNNNDKLLENLFNNEKLIHNMTVKNLQLLKNWGTVHKGVEINTYQEREWRYLPNDKYVEPVIYENDPKYNDLLDGNKKPKPHLREHPLNIDKIDDIKYIVVTTDLQRSKIIKTLNNRFTPDNTTKALVRGKLSILTASQIRNDF